MIILRNISDTIIDIVEEAIPIKRNQFDCLVRCNVQDADGYLGSNDKVHPIYGKGGTDYEMVASAVMVDEIPVCVKPMIYKYGTIGEDGTDQFYINEDMYDSLEGLVQRVTDLEAAVMELSRGVLT